MTEVGHKPAGGVRTVPGKALSEGGCETRGRAGMVPSRYEAEVWDDLDSEEVDDAYEELYHRLR